MIIDGSSACQPLGTNTATYGTFFPDLPFPDALSHLPGVGMGPYLLSCRGLHLKIGRAERIVPFAEPFSWRATTPGAGVRETH